MRNRTSPRPGGTPAVNGFTLVELLVVIAIIGILAGLLLAAVGPALGRGREARVRAEMSQFDTALEDYKNNLGSYPPNCQTDDMVTTGAEPVASPLDESAVLANLTRHFNKAFPQNEEPAGLLGAMVGLSPIAFGGSVSAPGQASNLAGGMTGAEAIVFWLGGFSDDPKYPISGPGGPAYADPDDATNPSASIDPVETRKGAQNFSVASLAPRDTNNYFDETDERSIVYRDPRDPSRNRRINFWRLTAPGGTTPYVYFDTSRASTVTAANDPAAASPLVLGTARSGMENFYAVKEQKRSSAAADLKVQFANNKKFQILAAGRDDAWGETPRVDPGAPDPATTLGDLLVDSTGAPLPLVSPDGPWTGKLADTLTNFADGTLEDAQP